MMLEALRNLLVLPVRARVRIYLIAVGALVATMTLFGFDPVGQTSSGAALWLAFSVGVLALTGRVVMPVKAAPEPVWQPKPQTSRLVLPSMPAPLMRSRHNEDLETRNLRGTAS